MGPPSRIAAWLCALLLCCTAVAEVQNSPALPRTLVLPAARSRSSTASVSLSSSHTRSITATQTTSRTESPSKSQTRSETRSPTATRSETRAQSQSRSGTRSPTVTKSESVSCSPTRSGTRSPSATTSETRSRSQTRTETRSSTSTSGLQSASRTQSSSMSTTNSQVGTTVSASQSQSQRMTPSQSPSRSFSATQTRTRFSSPGSPVTYAGRWVSVTVSGSVCTPSQWGAVGDGVADDTAAVQSAISSCAGHGGTVYLAAGSTFLVSGLSVPSTALPLAVVVDGVLRFSDFNTSSRHIASRSGECFGVQSDDFVLAGHGIVDGNSYRGWNTSLGSPRLVYAHAPMQRLLIANLTFMDSPFHNLQIYASSTEVVGVQILAGGTMAGTDGIDIHGDYTWVHDSRISVGDDLVAIHASHVLVERCTFGAGRGASIGSLDHEKALQNITVRDSTFNRTVHIAHIKANLHATGFVKDVTYANLKGVGIQSTVAVEMCREIPSCWKYPGVYPSVYPAIGLNMSNISFINISAVNSDQAGHFICHPTYRCGRSFFISNVVHTGVAPKPWVCVNADMTIKDSPQFPASCS